MSDVHQLTRGAYERLQAEYEDLTTRGRIEIAQAIERARELGDLSENGDYHAAKDAQGHMEGRIRQLDSILKNCEIVEEVVDGVVGAGSVVTILYEGDAEDMAETYLLGHIEERHGGLDVISPGSPLGEALTGHHAGELVHYQAPNGTLAVKIVSVASSLTVMSLDDGTPSLPPSRTIELPGRGSTIIRELPAPAGAPTLLLLHGWTATSDLNWFTSYAALGRRFGVVAIDHRGHGSGIRSSDVFRLEDCADDAGVLAAELGIESLIAVGYSMGGPVALLLARRWASLVRGLVLCSSAASFSTTRQDRFGFLALGALARASRLTPVPARTWLNDQYLERRARRYELWARRQVQRNDPTAVLEAGAAIGSFAAEPWLDTIRVPVAQIVTLQDHVVSLARQERLAAGLLDVEVSRLDADHDVCVARPDEFVPVLVAACSSVAARAGLEGDLAEGA